MAHGAKYSNIKLASVIGSCNEDFVLFLMEKGADVNAPDVFGSLPLGKAVALQGKCVSMKLIEQLITRGADVNARNSGGHTALYYALEKEKSDGRLVDLLIENGADVNMLPQELRNKIPRYLER